MMDQLHGYRPDLEDIPGIAATQVVRDWGQLMSPSCDRPLDSKVREQIKSRIIVEGQARTNSCGGHAGSTVVEYNRWLECGELDQRSRWAAYIWGQDECGMNTDSGVQIKGLCDALKKRGLCREPLWKFTGTYHRSPPGGAAALKACIEDAAQCKVSSWEMLNGYTGVARWLQTGQGGIVCAFPWYSNWYTVNGDVMPTPNGSYNGWHAYPFLWLTEKTEGSRYYVEGPNSWLPTWGKGGFAQWSPSLIDRLARIPGVLFVGLSDLDGTSVKPREVNRRDSSWFV